MYKGSFEEIKEVDDEYLYTSGVHSSENTERLLAQTNSGKNNMNRQNIDTKITNNLEINSDKINPLKVFTTSQGTIESQKTEKINDFEIDSPNQISPEEEMQTNKVEEHEYQTKAKLRSQTREKENKQSKWNCLIQTSSPINTRQLFDSKRNYKNNLIDSKNYLRRINESIEKAKSSMKQKRRNYRSIDTYEVSKRNNSNEDPESNKNKIHLKHGLKIHLKKSPKTESKNDAFKYSMFTMLPDASKNISYVHNNHLSNFFTHSSNRTIQSKVSKDGIFQDIVRKTSQSLITPFLKQKKQIEVLLKQERWEERVDKNRQKSPNNQFSHIDKIKTINSEHPLN